MKAQRNTTLINRLGIALALGFSMASGMASADSIGFETAFSGVTTNGVFYTESGMDFDFQGPLDAYSVVASQGFTSRYVDFHDHDFNNTATDSSYIEMRLTGGGLFDFTSADIFAETLGASNSANVYSNNGDLFSLTNNSAQNYVFNWSNVAWVRFDSYFDISFDNIVFNEASVPEPATTLLLLLGLGGLVTRRRMAR